MSLSSALYSMCVMHINYILPCVCGCVHVCDKRSGRHNLCQLCDVEHMRPRRVLWVAVTASPARACPISDFIGSSSDADTPTTSLPTPAHFFHHFFSTHLNVFFFIHVLSAVPSTAALHTAPHHISTPPVHCALSERAFSVFSHTLTGTLSTFL